MGISCVVPPRGVADCTDSVFLAEEYGPASAEVEVAEVEVAEVVAAAEAVVTGSACLEVAVFGDVGSGVVVFVASEDVGLVAVSPVPESGPDGVPEFGPDDDPEVDSETYCIGQRTGGIVPTTGTVAVPTTGTVATPLVAVTWYDSAR